jgi:hypothetical protein
MNTLKAIHTIFCCAVLVGGVAAQTAGEPVAAGPRMTDTQFFEALDLTNPQLAKVKAAVERGDLAAAKHAFVEHLKLRKTPKWFFDWRDKPSPDQRPKNPDVAAADRYARNELVSVGVRHNFGAVIDWSANPMPNKYNEWTWQLNRHPFWRTLGRAYWNTGDEKYVKAFVFQMTHWVRDNPVPLERPDQAAGSRWRTIEAGIRMDGVWLNALYYFLASATFSDEDVITMVKSFAEHAQYLMKFPTTGNWLTMEANGLYHVGAMFPEFKEAKTWRDTGIGRLYKELDIQVYPDGAQIELSTGYHQVSLRNFVGALEIAQLNNYPVPPDYLARLERMYNYNLYAAMPNGYLPGLNDGSYTNVRFNMREGYGYFPKRRDFRWMATDGVEGSPPEKTSYAFPYAGHFVMRSGWDKDARYLLFDGGPFGYGHQHEDKLNFVIHAYGANLVIDPGNYAYDSSPWRRYVIGSYAHNVIHVDGMYQNRRGMPRDQYVVKEPLPHEWKTTKAFDYAAASFGALRDEGFGRKREKPATHTRHILFVKRNENAPGDSADGDYWLVVDVLKPSDDKPHTYEAMFHLDVKDVAIDSTTKRVATLNEDSANLAIVPLADAGLSVEVVKGQENPYVQGWHPAGGYNVRPIPTVVYKRATAGVTYFIYVFYPLPKGVKPPAILVEPVRLAPDDVRVKVKFGDEATDEFQVGKMAPSVAKHRRP